MDKIFFIIETYDEEKDLRQQHHVDFEKFKDLLLRRWPELAETINIATGHKKLAYGPSDEQRYRELAPRK